MATRASISISFTPEQAEFLNSLVRHGEFQSVSEVVRAALRPFQHRRRVLEAEMERARGEIAVGAEDLDRGRVVESDAFFAEWDAELDDWEESSRRHRP